jgi:hypothetical protein
MIKAFLKKTIVLVCLIAISFYALSYIVDAGLRKSRNNYYASWNDLYDSKINADLLVLGSSRAAFHVSPSIIDSVLKVNSYNLGLSAWHFDMQYARFKIYLKYNHKPKYIIHNVDVYGFCKRADVVDAQQFLPYLNDSILLATTKGHKGAFDLYQQKIPLWKYKNQQSLVWEGMCNYFNVLALHDTTTMVKGYRGYEYAWNQDFERFKKRYPKGVRYTFSKEIEQQFEEYLSFCKREGIQVVLFSAPEYYEVQPYYKNKQTMIALCRAMTKKYGCVFLDYSKDSICYHKKYFYNSQHLNTAGSKVFSKQLAKELKAIIH